jgi:hypothetical protein
MGLPLFDRIQHADELINRIQDRLKTVINTVMRKPLIDGQLVSWEVSPLTTNVPHGLGRVPRGYFVVSGQANLIGQTAPADASFLYVSTGGGTETITFWVF